MASSLSRKISIIYQVFKGRLSVYEIESEEQEYRLANQRRRLPSFFGMFDILTLGIPFLLNYLLELTGTFSSFPEKQPSGIVELLIFPFNVLDRALYFTRIAFGFFTTIALTPLITLCHILQSCCSLLGKLCCSPSSSEKGASKRPSKSGGERNPLLPLYAANAKNSCSTAMPYNSNREISSQKFYTRHPDQNVRVTSYSSNNSAATAGQTRRR